MSERSAADLRGDPGSLPHLDQDGSSGPEVFVRPPAEIDPASVPDLEGLVAAIDPASTIVVDMREVAFCDSCGLSALVRTKRRQEAGGGSMVLLEPGENLLRLLRGCGMADTFVVRSLRPAGVNGAGRMDGTAVALTPREREVLALLGQGHDPKTIARDLVMSVHTARGHVKSVMAKLDAHSQVEAVVVAARLGLLRFDE